MSVLTGSDPVVVIGGGLAGLTAAVFVARQNRPVLLLEQASTIGGRARSLVKDNFTLNMGPHALLRNGPGLPILEELSVNLTGGTPPARGFGLLGDRLCTLPADFRSLLGTRLLSLRGKYEMARFFLALPRLDPQKLADLPLQDWVESRIRNAGARQLLLALFRLATYAHDPQRQSAGAALAQLQAVVLGKVLYLDGGWQTLVEQLREHAEAEGVQVRTGVRVTAILRERQRVHSVRLGDGSVEAASAVIVAAGPATACALLQDGEATVLRDWARAAIPVHAACLDVALHRLPDPRMTFALGIDRPLYFQVHSAYARLAPPGGAVVHVAKNLAPGVSQNPEKDERELEGLLDMMQPGWRQMVARRRFLPRMLVANAMTTAAQQGTGGRPSPKVPGIDNLFVAGDWVGQQGMLADASLASARQAAELVATVGQIANLPLLTRAAS